MSNWKEKGYESFGKYLLDKNIPYQERLMAVWSRVPLKPEDRAKTEPVFMNANENEAETALRSFAIMYGELTTEAPEVLELEAALKDCKVNTT